MTLIYKYLLVFTALLLISACDSADRFSTLKKCTVLGDESIVYARAHYVKLFYHFNPNKFADSFKQIGNFDAVTHKNTIDTYSRAIEKVNNKKQGTDDQVTKRLLTTCNKLAEFSTHFVKHDYPRAMKFKSKNDPLTDDFFIEINQLVKFDHNIGAFNSNDTSFKQNIESYKNAVDEYINQYRTDIPSEFVKQRASKSE